MAGVQLTLAMAEEMPTHAATADLANVFRPVKFDFSKVHFYGGLLKKSMPLTTKNVTVHNQEKIFVKMTASDPWLISAVTGQKADSSLGWNSRSRGLGRTTLLAMLRSCVAQAYNGELDEIEVDEYDPMQEIEVDDGTHSRSRGVEGRARLRYPKQNKAKNRLVTVTVPAVSPEEDPMSTSTRTIQLYLVDFQQVWLDIDDVEWALRYLHMQFVRVTIDDAGPSLLTPQKRKANDPW